MFPSRGGCGEGAGGGTIDETMETTAAIIEPFPGVDCHLFLELGMRLLYGQSQPNNEI